MTRKRLKTPGQRQLRVGEEIRHSLARMLGQGGLDALDDPALFGKAFTVTEVRLSPDLRNATAFVVPFGAAVHLAETGPGAAAAAGTGVLLGALNRAAGYFRGRLGHEIDMRYIPRLLFRFDESFAQASRIEALLGDPAVARDLGPGEEAEGD